MPRTVVDELLAWLSEREGPLGYLVLAAASALEYIVPPLPGDTVTLFGTFLAATAGYSVALVYLTLTGGSIAGSLVAWSFGRYIGHHEDGWPRFLQGEGTRRGIHRIIDGFDRHGGLYLAINRFLPAMRSLFFVAAGMAEMPLSRVVLFGGFSAAAWNLLILGVGYGVGNNWERLESLSRDYTYASLTVAGVVLVGFALRWGLTRRRER